MGRNDSHLSSAPLATVPQPRLNAKGLSGPGTYLPFPETVASKGHSWENETNSVQDELIFIQYLLIPKIQVEPDPLPQIHRSIPTQFFSAEAQPTIGYLSSLTHRPPKFIRQIEVGDTSPWSKARVKVVVISRA